MTKRAINITHTQYVDSYNRIIPTEMQSFNSDRGASCSLERQISTNDKVAVLADNYRGKARCLLPVQLLVRNYRAVQVEEQWNERKEQRRTGAPRSERASAANLAASRSIIVAKSAVIMLDILIRGNSREKPDTSSRCRRCHCRHCRRSPRSTLYPLSFSLKPSGRTSYSPRRSSP